MPASPQSKSFSCLAILQNIITTLFNIFFWGDRNKRKEFVVDRRLAASLHVSSTHQKRIKLVSAALVAFCSAMAAMNPGSMAEDVAFLTVLTGLATFVYQNLTDISTQLVYTHTDKARQRQLILRSSAAAVAAIVGATLGTLLKDVDYVLKSTALDSVITSLISVLITDISASALAKKLFPNKQAYEWFLLDEINRCPGWRRLGQLLDVPLTGEESTIEAFKTVKAHFNPLVQYIWDRLLKQKALSFHRFLSSRTNVKTDSYDRILHLLKSGDALRSTTTPAGTFLGYKANEGMEEVEILLRKKIITKLNKTQIAADDMVHYGSSLDLSDVSSDRDPLIASYSREQARQLEKLRDLRQLCKIIGREALFNEAFDSVVGADPTKSFTPPAVSPFFDKKLGRSVRSDIYKTPVPSDDGMVDTRPACTIQ